MVDPMIDRLRDALRQDPDVDVAALFGSAARGRLTAESDIDVYVRLRSGAHWSAERVSSINRALEHIASREVDLVIEDRSETSTLLRMEVARHGVLLFEREAGGWASVRAHATVDYADMEPFMRRIGDGIRRRARERASG